VVLGASARDFVHAAGAQPAGPGTAAIDAGRVGEWSLRLQLRVVAAETEEVEARRILQASSWWTIASSGPDADPIWTSRFETLTRWLDAQRRDVVVALFGAADLSRYWHAYGGPNPIAHADRPAPILRALTRDFLRRTPT
jgi:hypothetical protein